jgi:hypothetical protein
MMEGYDPEAHLSKSRSDPISEENKRLTAEVEKLRALLAEHNISAPPIAPPKPSRKPRRSLRLCNKNGELGMEEDKPLPVLPAEILLRILGFAVTSPTPVIDPFYKLRKHNITKEERSSRNHLNMNFLATCKAFNVEGKKLIVEKNQFLFTQVAALERFAQVPASLRANIEHLSIRCVGRYYHDSVKKLDLEGDNIYHHTMHKLEVQSYARPAGLISDGGIQAYCWYQVADFLKTLALPYDKKTGNRPKLLPGLKTFHLDLVNFCDHLPLGIWSFASILRWHLGMICDELLITGMPAVEGGSDEEMLLRNLLRDEGLISTGCPRFVSMNNSLKALSGYGYTQQVVRARTKTSALKKYSHPEGGKPPKSIYPASATIWKWTTDHSGAPKSWIEFDRISGHPMSDLDEFDTEENSDVNDSDLDPDSLDMDDGFEDYDDDDDLELPPLVDIEEGEEDGDIPSLVDIAA